VHRRVFLGTLAGGLLAAPLAAAAQGPGKPSKKVGILSVGGESPATIDPFFRELRELGWVEGQNLTIERRIAEGREERLPGLAAELTQLRVDVILAAGGPASLNAARKATKAIPIVMVASSRDPIGTRLIQSYARPGGNITGIVTAPEQLTGKQLELLKTVAPGLSRIGVLWDGTTGNQFRVDGETAETARALNVELLAFEVRHATEFSTAVDAAAKERVGGLLLPGSPMFVRNRQQIAELLTRRRLPAISVWRSFVDAGMLMAYGPSLPDQFRQAAGYVDKILKGARPGDLPVERPTKFDFVINLKTAKALGLTIPPSLLQRADQVIE
jgi:putative tryptophan/tyrosine transport system substrate-binding protein